MEVDTGAHGPEGSHAVVGTELRGAVQTHREVQQVDVVVGVVAREEHADQTGLVLRFGGFALDLRGVVRRVERPGRETDILDVIDRIAGLDGVSAQREVQEMLVEIPVVHEEQVGVVGERVRTVHGQRTQLLRRCEGAVRGRQRIDEDPRLVGALAQGDPSLGGEVRRGVEVDCEVVLQRPVVAAAEIVQVFTLVERVERRIAETQVLEVVARGLVDRHVVGQHVGELREGIGRVGRTVGVVGGAVHQLELADAVVEEKPRAVGVALRIAHDALVAGIFQLDPPANVVLTAVDIDAVLVVHRGPEVLRKPVGVHAAVHLVEFLVIGLVFIVDVLVEIGGVERIEPRIEFGLQFLAGVHQVVGREVGHLDASGQVVGDAQFAGLRGARLDDHHAVGGARSVKHRRGGVFQQRDRVYAHGVHVVDLLHIHLEAVEDEDRQVGVVREVLTRNVGRGVQLGGDAVLTADVELRQRVRVRTHRDVLGQPERGVEHLDGVDHPLGRNLDDLLLGDPRGVAREALLADLRITRNDHVVDALHLVEQLHVQFRLVVVGYLAALHAEEAHRHDRPGTVREAKRIIAVGIGRRADGRTLDMDHRPGNRGLRGAVRHPPGQRNPLGGGRSGRSLRVGLRRLVRFADADDDRILADGEIQPGAVERLAQDLLDGSVLPVQRNPLDGFDRIAIVEQQITRFPFDVLKHIVERRSGQSDRHPFLRLSRPVRPHGLDRKDRDRQQKQYDGTPAPSEKRRK